MTVLLILGLAWLAVAAVTALVAGRGIHLADERSEQEQVECCCGHTAVAHQHNRAGSDCAFCACSRLAVTS